MKPFKSIDEQIALLRKRNLRIDDYNQAYNMLGQTSYYSLINGYKNIFLCTERSKEQDYFDDDVSLKDIINLYDFDRALRKEYLEGLEDLEETISTIIAYYLAENYGTEKNEYLNFKNFRDGRVTRSYDYNKKRYLRELEVLLKKINGIYYSDNHPMKHYRNKYNNVPPWILVKGMTFRNKYFLYKLLKNEDKTIIISRCLNIDQSEVTESVKSFFISALDLMVTYRNWIAHGNRFFSHKSRVELPYNEIIHDRFGIDKHQYSLGQGRNDVYALSIAIAYFFYNHGVKRGRAHVGVNFYLKKYCELNQRHAQKVLSELGFPTEHYYYLTGIEDKELVR